MNGFKDRIVKDSFIAKYDLEEEKKTIIQRIYDYECYIKGLEQCINYNHTMSDFVIRAKISLDNKKQILYKISEEHHRMCGSYRCPAEMTRGGQDMSYWVTYRERVMNDYKEKALNEIRVEWIRLLKNCKTVLTDYDYDMFEEFKKVYPNMANYFNFKVNDITWDIAGEYGNNMKNFIDCVIKCLLSQEALNKRNEKIRKQKEIRTISIEERRTLLYKKEYECMKILNELDKNKLKSPELYVEYKKITELKDGVESIFGKHPDLDNNPFIDYFTEYRKKYINGLIELVNNPTPVNEGQSTMTQVDVDALFNKAVIFHGGRGVVQDYVEAARLYRLAAEQGHTLAQYNLGSMFYGGRGVAQDYVEAARLYRLAAEQGYTLAQYNLGCMCSEAIGIAQDYVEAVRLWRLAAEQGYKLAQYNLGSMFSEGTGVVQDYAEAARLYRLAAEQGHASAQYNIGLMFEFGRGVVKDKAEAVRWYRLAAAQGNTRAQKKMTTMFCDGRGVSQDNIDGAHLHHRVAEHTCSTLNIPENGILLEVFDKNKSKHTQEIFQPSEQDTSENNIVMTVVEVKENKTNKEQVCNKSVKKPTKKALRKEKDIIRVLNIFTNQNMKKKYFDSGIYKVVLNTPLHDPINEYNKKCISSYKLGEYLDFLYKKEISEFCLDDKKYYEFMSKSTLIPL